MSEWCFIWFGSYPDHPFKTETFIHLGHRECGPVRTPTWLLAGIAFCCPGPTCWSRSTKIQPPFLNLGHLGETRPALELPLGSTKASLRTTSLLYRCWSPKHSPVSPPACKFPSQESVSQRTNLSLENSFQKLRTVKFHIPFVIRHTKGEKILVTGQEVCKQYWASLFTWWHKLNSHMFLSSRFLP